MHNCDRMGGICYDIARNKVKCTIREEERDLRRRTVVNKTNEDLEGGMKQTGVGTKRILGKQAGEADTGIATLRAHNGKMVSTR